MFVYVYVDILAFYKPGTVRDILEGRVWEFDITQGWALGVLVLMTVPSLMSRCRCCRRRATGARTSS